MTTGLLIFLLMTTGRTVNLCINDEVFLFLCQENNNLKILSTYSIKLKGKISSIMNYNLIKIRSFNPLP